MQIIYVYRLQGLFDVLPVLARSNACQAIVENLSDTKRTNFSYQANASCKTQVRNLCFRKNTNSFNSCSSDSKTRSAKYTTLRLTHPTLLDILALFLTNILPSLAKLHLSPMPATITFVSFAVSGLILIPQLPVPLLPLSFTPNLTNLYYKLPESQLSRLQQIQNSLARTVVKAPMSCNIIPILRFLHWLRINERIEYMLLSLTYKVLTITQPPHTFITSFPCTMSS